MNKKGFLSCMKQPGFRISSDRYCDSLYALSEINTKALVGEAMNASFKGK